MLNGNYGLILLYLSLFFLISTDMYLRTNVPFQYTISGDREQVFLLYYKDFFEQICSDVQFISPPEEVGEFLLHLLNHQFHLKSIFPSYMVFPSKHLRFQYQIKNKFLFLNCLRKSIIIQKLSFQLTPFISCFHKS